MEKINGFLLAIITIFFGISISPSFTVFAGEGKAKQSIAVLRCTTDEQCDNLKACDGSEFCVQGTCQSTEVDPCARIGKKYCVNERDNTYFCHECRDDSDCGKNRYCNRDFWQCQKRRGK